MASHFEVIWRMKYLRIALKTANPPKEIPRQNFRPYGIKKSWIYIFFGNEVCSARDPNPTILSGRLYIAHHATRHKT